MPPQVAAHLLAMLRTAADSDSSKDREGSKQDAIRFARLAVQYSQVSVQVAPFPTPSALLQQDRTSFRKSNRKMGHLMCGMICKDWSLLTVQGPRAKISYTSRLPTAKAISNHLDEKELKGYPGVHDCR